MPIHLHLLFKQEQPQTEDDEQITIFDSGVGGLNILKEIETQLPNENLYYIADQQYVPYGTKSKEFITKRINTIFSKVKPECKIFVIACNTATKSAIITVSDSTADNFGIKLPAKVALAELKKES